MLGNDDDGVFGAVEIVGAPTEFWSAGACSRFCDDGAGSCAWIE
jgi:hypothetical protein